MPTKAIVLAADTIDGAAEQIIHLLEGTDNRRDVIYFHGWFGFGASAVLKAVVKKLRSSSGRARDLGKIIHVDVLQWQSKRALQKVIAEELELPPQVMALFHQHDEEDDFDGVEQRDRTVIPLVKAAIMNELMAPRFLVVFHNGSGSYIDLWEAGVPVMGQLGRRVLWTSQGRFWHNDKDGHEEGEIDTLDMSNVESAKRSDATICVVPSSIYVDDDAIQVMRHALYAEAEEVAKYTGVPEPDMSARIVIECILYRALLQDNVNINWESHGSNYLVCDGIIQEGTDGGSGRSAWEISDALQRNMSLDFCREHAIGICRALSGEHKRCIKRWVSDSTEVQLTSRATSFLCTTEEDMFEHSDGTTNLRVIHLSHCTFSFSSPPFASCSNLRFLLLDDCKDQDTQELVGEEKKCRYHRNNCSQQDGRAWFQNLWVLELSYTDWYWLLSKDMLDLMVDLRELNVKGAGNQSMMHLHRCSGGAGRSNTCNKLVKLGVVAESYGTDGERIIQPSEFPDLSSWHILKTIILDGCGDLETIGSDALPLQSLELFSLTGNETTKIKSISFRGCAQLKTLLLRGLFLSLEELDMSGTAIKTLDLSAAQAWDLKRLFLLGCEKLHAILWPQDQVGKDNNKKKVRLEVLRIDTTTHEREQGNKHNKKQEEAIAASDDDDNARILVSSSLAKVCGKDRTVIDSDSYISIRDSRLFRSLVHLRHSLKLYVEISSSTGGHKLGTAATSEGILDSNNSNACGQQKHTGNLYYVDDIISTSFNFNSNSQADDDDVDSRDGLFKVEAPTMKSMWLWHCPPIPKYRCPHLYISIQDDGTWIEPPQGTTTSSSSTQITLPDFVHVNAMTLRLHDSFSITCLPGPALATTTDVVNLRWGYLEWCRLERCPGLEGVVFTTPLLRQAGAPIFRSLETFWASQLSRARYIWNWSTSGVRPGQDSFQHLSFLHLDYCPRLVHVLPLYTSNTKGCCSLETLEIVCCGDLREVFPSDSKLQQQQGPPREFPRLKRIHLYDLPKLQRICGHSRMLAPRLQTVKIRACWNLKRLPAAVRDEDEYEDITPSSMVDLDCEKEWWDNLEWDGEEAGHHPSHYKPTYSAYYKKNQLRASVLR